jgi:hypothetical protein
MEVDVLAVDLAVVVAALAVKYALAIPAAIRAVAAAFVIDAAEDPLEPGIFRVPSRTVRDGRGARGR